LKLSEFIKVSPRYSRSVNLERDVGNASSLTGYILSDRNCDNTKQIIEQVFQWDSPRAWTITGLYGTGKSAFANFLLGLLGSTDSSHHRRALAIFKHHKDYDQQLFRRLRLQIRRQGLIRSVATASAESLSNTIIRALYRGALEFWAGVPGAKPAVLKSLTEAATSVTDGVRISPVKTLEYTKALAAASKSGLIVLVDELGKNLEHAVSNQSDEDLFLLQQLAELPSSNSDPIVCVVGVLHQSFSEYAHQLTVTQQREWAKIQGRFEDIPFRESPLQLTKLIGQALISSAPLKTGKRIKRYSSRWAAKELFRNNATLSIDEIASLYPLHPIAAAVLPQLAERFAQNDRSVFTFLSSHEPYSFGRYLESQSLGQNLLPTLKLHNLYNYFIESLGLGMAHHTMFQRWAEIQSAVADAERYGSEFQNLLKTIGILNLVSTAGDLRASKDLVLKSMVDQPDEITEGRWRRILDELLEKSLAVYRIQVDELRIWQGSDFDISQAVRIAENSLTHSTAELLNNYFSQSPLIAARHSYQTGTLRFFERHFLDRETLRDLKNVKEVNGDGLLFYWTDKKEPAGSLEIFGNLTSGKPVLIIQPEDCHSLRDAVKEFAALHQVTEISPEVRTDGVARKELKHRLRIARDIVERVLQQSFHLQSTKICLVDSNLSIHKIEGKSLSFICSDILDEVYHAGPILLNELINRKSLTSQAAKARRELFEHMIEFEGQPKLGIKGYGPERSMLESVLVQTGIYRQRGGKWTFGPPLRNSGVLEVWNAVEKFCLGSRKTPENVQQLYTMLQGPPFGVRSELIPVFLVAALLTHAEDVVMYYQGSFIPVLSAANLELLVKHPYRFSIMYFKIAGARKKLFARLKSILNIGRDPKSSGVRNVSLLGVLKPLMRFVRSLPEYTIHTKNLDVIAMSIRDALLNGRHPDKLVFDDLPLACGLPPIQADEDSNQTIEEFNHRFTEALRILDTTYDQLLIRNASVLGVAFSIDGDIARLREHLKVKSSYLLAVAVEPKLRRFLLAVTDDSFDDQSWLESVCMVISDTM